MALLKMLQKRIKLATIIRLEILRILEDVKICQEMYFAANQILTLAALHRQYFALDLNNLLVEAF